MWRCRTKTKLILITSLSLFTLLHWYNSSVNLTNQPSVTTQSAKLHIEKQTPDQIQHNVRSFTDLLADLRQFGPDKEATDPRVNELSGQEVTYHTETNRGVTQGVTYKPESNKGVTQSVVKPETIKPDPVSWLYDAPNVKIYPSVTEDILPDYFDPDIDQVSQFERYHDRTRAIIDKRLETLEKSCARIRQYMKHEQDFIFYFPDLRMGWCPVFKAASTNWKQFFCKIYLPDVYDEWRVKTNQDPYCPLGELLDYSVRNREIKLKQQSKTDPGFDGLGALSELRSGLGDSVKFLTVRHPYERLVSMYTNKFKDCVSRMYSNPDGVMVKIFQLYRKTEQKFSPEEKARLIEEARSECGKPLDKRQIDKDNPYMNPMGASFKEVIQFIISNFMNGVWPDFHWIQVTKSCDVCSKKYKVIEKFETLERDHYFLLKTLGEEARYPDIAGSHGNPSVKARNPHDLVFQYFSQLDENMLWDLQAVYKDDFAAFGYNPHFRLKKNPYNRV